VWRNLWMPTKLSINVMQSNEWRKGESVRKMLNMFFLQGKR
jgi:hypothetical protein